MIIARIIKIVGEEIDNLKERNSKYKYDNFTEFNKDLDTLKNLIFSRIRNTKRVKK